MIPSSINTSLNESDVLLEIIESSLKGDKSGNAYIGYPLTTDRNQSVQSDNIVLLNNSIDRQFEIHVSISPIINPIILKGIVGDYLHLLNQFVVLHCEKRITISKFILQLPNTSSIELDHYSPHLEELYIKAIANAKGVKIQYSIDDKTGAILETNVNNLVKSVISKGFFNPYVDGLDGEGYPIRNFVYSINPTNDKVPTRLNDLVEQLESLDNRLITLSVSTNTNCPILFNRKSSEGVIKGLYLLRDLGLVLDELTFNFIMISQYIEYDFKTVTNILDNTQNKISSVKEDILKIHPREFYTQKNFIISSELDEILNSFSNELGELPNNLFVSLFTGNNVGNKLIFLALREQLINATTDHKKILSKVFNMYSNFYTPNESNSFLIESILKNFSSEGILKDSFELIEKYVVQNSSKQYRETYLISLIESEFPVGDKGRILRFICKLCSSLDLSDIAYESINLRV